MDNILVSIQTRQFALHLNMFDTYSLVHLTCVSTQSHAAARYISLAVVRLEEVCLSVCSVFCLLFWNKSCTSAPLLQNASLSNPWTLTCATLTIELIKDSWSFKWGCVLCSELCFCNRRKANVDIVKPSDIFQCDDVCCIVGESFVFT